MEQLDCKNCDFTYKGKFCPECGQKAKTQRLDWSYLQDEAKYTFLHINGGLLYTCKQLFTRPGDMIREFIEGKRIHHYKPVLLLFLLAGIYGLLMHYMDFGAFISTVSADGQDPRMNAFLTAFYDWMTAHYSLIEILQLPIFSFCSWLAFRKWGYNFVEHVILNTFSASQRLIYNIMLMPLLILMGSSSITMILSSFLTLGSFALTTWTYITFFRQRDLGEIILRLLFFAFLIFVFFIITIIIAIVAIVIFWPEAFPRG